MMAFRSKEVRLSNPKPVSERWAAPQSTDILGVNAGTDGWGIDPPTMEVTASKPGESLLLLWGHQVVYQVNSIKPSTIQLDHSLGYFG